MIPDRGVSVTVDYVMMLGIATIVLASVVFAASGVIDAQVDRAVESDLTVSGERLGGEVEAADRLFAGGDAGESSLSVIIELPREAGGSAYYIGLTDNQITLSTDRPDHEIELTVNTTLSLVPDDRIRGGPVEIVITGDEIEVRPA